MKLWIILFFAGAASCAAENPIENQRVEMNSGQDAESLYNPVAGMKKLGDSIHDSSGNRHKHDARSNQVQDANAYANSQSCTTLQGESCAEDDTTTTGKGSSTDGGEEDTTTGITTTGGTTTGTGGVTTSGGTGSSSGDDGDTGSDTSPANEECGNLTTTDYCDAAGLTTLVSSTTQYVDADTMMNSICLFASTASIDFGGFTYDGSYTVQNSCNIHIPAYGQSVKVLRVNMEQQICIELPGGQQLLIEDSGEVCEDEGSGSSPPPGGSPPGGSPPPGFP